MKNIFKTLVIASLCLVVPVSMCAQNKAITPEKGKTTKIKNYPQCDSAFKADYKLTPIGPFNANKVEKLNYTLVPAPDFTGHMLKRDISRKQVKPQQMSFQPNQIIDDDLWVERNGLVLREQRIETPMNQFAPRFQYKTGGYLITTYGMNWGCTMKVVITDEEQKTLFAAYDFENFKYSPQTETMGNYQSVNDFYIEGNVLYFAHGFKNYSDGAGYHTGYITAFDMEKQDIIWTTQPQTCNSHFAIVGNSIICGYGLNDEADNLFVVDKYSGQRVNRMPMKNMVYEVVPKDDKVYVRTYSYNYVFRIR